MGQVTLRARRTVHVWGCGGRAGLRAGEQARALTGSTTGHYGCFCAGEWDFAGRTTHRRMDVRRESSFAELPSMPAFLASADGSWSRRVSMRIDGDIECPRVYFIERPNDCAR